MSFLEDFSQSFDFTAYTWVFYAAVGIAVAFILIAITFMAGRSRNLTALHGLAFGAIAMGAALAAQYYLGLMDWIYIGLMGYDIGALMFVIGLFAMIGVMAWNFIQSNGDTLVR